MPGRLAVDFGTSNTVVALWDETLQQGVPLRLSVFDPRDDYAAAGRAGDRNDVYHQVRHLKRSFLLSAAANCFE